MKFAGIIRQRVIIDELASQINYFWLMCLILIKCPYLQPCDKFKSSLALYGPPHMTVQKQDDQHELTYSNYVRTQDVTLKTCRRRWVIERSGERGSGISVLAVRHDDDDDDDDLGNM